MAQRRKLIRTVPSEKCRSFERMSYKELLGIDMRTLDDIEKECYISVGRSAVSALKKHKKELERDIAELKKRVRAI